MIHHHRERTHPVTYTLDPELAAVLQDLARQSGPTTAPAEDDWRALREMGTAAMQWMATMIPNYPADYPDVEASDHTVRSQDGTEIAVRWYHKIGSKPGSAVVYAHGGGMILGSVDLYDPVVAGYVSSTGVPFLSVDYRLAPEVTAPIPVEDVVAGLRWVHDHATELDVEPERVAVMGDSAGGGIAAGAAIRARQAKIPLSQQILVYPMLDDRTATPDGRLEPFLSWTYANNRTGWRALLGKAYGTDAVPPTVAPARVVQVGGLPAAYIEVGEMDIFRAEAVDYARRLADAAIPVELHVHRGAIHGYERLAPTSALAQRAMADRERVITAL
jgi:acetyl esterase/lipase